MGRSVSVIQTCAYNYLWYFKGPLQLIITLFLLYRQMQLAILPGVAFLLIMIPINLYLQRIQKKLAVCICKVDFIFNCC